MNGYTRIPHELMRNASLPPIAKVVWSLIAGMRDDYRPTIARYCEMVPCHPDTWRATVKMLESYGMITVERVANWVKYSAITDTSKWSIPNKDPMKISHPMKISEGMKKSHPKGMKISEGEGMKISHPLEEHKNNNKNNNKKEYAHAQGFGEIWDEWFGLPNQTIENLCMHEKVTIQELMDAAECAITDLVLNGETEKLGKADKKKKLYGLMLFKIRNLNNGRKTSINGNGKTNTVTGFKILTGS